MFCTDENWDVYLTKKNYIMSFCTACPVYRGTHVGGDFTKPTATKQTDKIIEKLNEL